jgi:uncharacterized protein YbgA (DUF1722 family)/uncharacterized protein YbbK (DUF523 family)
MIIVNFSSLYSELFHGNSKPCIQNQSWRQQLSAGRKGALGRHGNHKQDSVVKNQLGRIFEWVSTCPEVEIGMGIPRESVQLTGSSKAPRMVGNRTGTDWTRRMNRYSKKRSAELVRMNVCGYIFKSKSPSCGIARINVISNNGKTQSRGRGLFADSFMQQYPLMPIEDEDRLHNAPVRENFITRVFAYHRLTQLLKGRLSRKALEEFHRAHKYLLMAHSRKHETALATLVANAKPYSPSELRRRYTKGFMQALTFKTTVKKNVVALNHMLKILKKSLSEAEEQKLIQTIENYRNGTSSLTKPIARIKRHVRTHKIEYLANQVYLHSH